MAHGQYRPGDSLVVYTYQGEGAFTVWRDGRMYTEELGFSPYGGSSREQCNQSGLCWGALSRELRPQWWAKVRLADGRLLWVSADDGFEGQDACG